MNRQAGALIGLTAVVGFLLGLVAAGTQPISPTSALPLRPSTSAAPPITVTTADATASPIPSTGVDFASVAARINSAVVNVDTASRAVDDRARFSRRYPGDDSGSPREGSGSGFVIDPAGY